MKNLEIIKELIDSIEAEQRAIRTQLGFKGLLTGHTYVRMMSDPGTKVPAQVFAGNERTLTALRQAYAEQQDVDHSKEKIDASGRTGW